jgi:heme O synthase-like polyprenyltransferase
MMLLAMPVFAAGYDDVVNPIISLLNNLLGPILALVGAIGTLYCVLLGVKFAKAEEPQEREKAKTHLKNAIIGFVLIFVLIVVLKIGMGVMVNWVKESTGTDVGTLPSGN